MSAARIDTAGRVTVLDGRAEPDETVTEQDVQDAPKLAKLLARLLQNVASLRRTFSPRRIAYEVAAGSAGALTQLAHNFVGRVRWHVSGWQTTATPTVENGLNHGSAWIRRALFGPGTLASVAGDFTVGARWRATSACLVSGARFLWVSAGGAKSVKVTLWRDSSAAVLGTATVSVNATGVYVARFATPFLVTGADLSVDLTIGFYETGAGFFSRTGVDAVFATYLPLTLPGLELHSVALFLASDARPTSTSVSGNFWIEPLIEPAFPQLIESTATDSSTLALTSYAPGTAIVHVEEAG